MRGIRQWMSDHSEITGILVFLLIVIVIGGASYGISYAVGGGVKNTAPSGQVADGGTKSSDSQSGAAGESGDNASQPSNGGESSPSQLESSSEASESSQPSDGQNGQNAAQPSNADGQYAVGDTINEYGVYFQIVDEQVTAKIETNLRRVPSTEKDEDVIATIYNGDWIKRTGIGHNGWSRVEYQGQVLYAVTSYLSTDGTSSSVPTYQEVSEQVTAKEEVHLRSEPNSGSEENIVATLTNGEFITRTGIGSNGWSRIDYNGTEVYAVTSLLTTAQ